MRVELLAASAALAASLNNGVGFLPELGFNSWYAIHENLINYTWRPGYCASCDVSEIADYFTANGLLALGFNRINYDDCIVVGRDASGDLIPDPAAFPSGVRAAADALHAKGFQMGWYTVRGEHTCASGPPPRIERPGSVGHELQDAKLWSSWGIDYIKDDTCGGTEVPYPVMRDALNASGGRFFFSMCEPGNGPQTAPVGRSWGNAWRTDIDDGGLWRPILQNVNTNAGLYNYSGCEEQRGRDGFGCGFNDMGLLMVGGGMSYDQDRSHLALWAIMMNKLLVSVDPRKWSPWALGLVGNPEVVAIDQDGLKMQGQRVVPPLNATRAAEDRARITAWKAAHLPGGSWRAAGRALELLAHPDAGAVPGTEDDEVLAAGGRVEVWQRPLVGGAWALLLFNNGVAGEAPVACTGACWARMGWSPSDVVAVRDVFARTDNGTASGGITLSVPTNGTHFLRLEKA